MNELRKWRQEWKLLTFGFVAAFLDGIFIAQAMDWFTATGRMSIWVLM